MMGKHEFKDDDTYLDIYDNLESLLNDQLLTKGKECKDDVNRSSFIGRNFYKLQDAIDAARKEWPEGEELVMRMISRLEAIKLPRPKSRKRKKKWNADDGDYFDYDRMRSGNSEYWLRKEPRLTTGPKHVTIMTNVAAYGSVEHNDVLWRGATAVILTKILEDAGYRVELWVTRKSRGCMARHQGTTVEAVRLKAHREPLNVATLVAGVSCWLYRTVFFARQIAKGEEIGQPIRMGHGAPCNVSDIDLRYILGGDIPEDVIQIHDVWSEHAALQTIEKALASYAKQ